MAEYKNSIMLGIKLPSNQDVNGQLQTLIKTLNNTKIDLDINIKNSDVAKQLEALTSLANNFKSSLGGNVSLGDINNIINQATSSMERLNGEVLKTRTVLSTDGNYGNRYSEIANGIGVITKQTEILNKETQDWELTEEGKSITIVNNAKIKQSIEDISNAQQRLNQLEQNGFANKNKVADLQNMFSNPNNFSSDNELKNYLNQVKQLESEELKLIQIQKEELDLINQMANGREKSELKSQQIDRTNELNQAKAINKAKEDEYKLQQQIKNSETNSLTKDINSTIAQVEKLQSKFGSKLPNGFVESTTKDLNSLLNKLKETDNVNFNNIRNSLNTIKSSMEQTTNETKQLVNSLKETNNGGFFGSITNFLSKVGLFYGVQQVVQEITSQLKDAVNYTIEMDKSMTNMQMITGKSKGEIVSVVNNYKQLGEQLHTTNAEMMKGMEEVTRAGFDGKEGEALMSASIMGSKLSGQTTEQVTQQLIAIKNAFNMTGESMQSVVDMMSKMDNVSATSFKEIASAIQRTAFSAQEAGTPLSNLITYITTVSEKTRRSADTIGESFKTIYSRYSNIKLGRLDDDGKSINDTEFAMNRIGIAIRNNKGQFKEFDTVLQEFMQKFKSGQLSQVDYLAGIQALAGTRQRETLMALMENMDTLNQHQKEVGESAGSAKKMMEEAYGQSLDARIQDLKRAFEQLYEKITNSEQLKWLVTEFTQLITALTNVDGKTILFTASIGGLIVVMSKLSSLNKTLIAGEAITGLSKFIAVLSGMSTVSATINEATIATRAFQVAQASAIAQTEGVTGLKGAWLLLSSGIKDALASSVAFMATPLGLVLTALTATIGLVVAGFVAYKQHQEELIEKSKELKTALDGVNSSLKGGDTKGAGDNLDKIKKELDEYKRLTDLKKEYEEKLKTAGTEKNIAGMYGVSETEQYTATIKNLDKQLEEHKQVLNDAGISEETFAQKQQEIANQDIVDKIKNETQAQIEHRINMSDANEEYNNYISSVQKLYSEYQNLSSQENLSSEQKKQLSVTVEQLQNKIGNLNTQMDDSGKTYIINQGLISDTIGYYQNEGMTVQTLTSIRLADEKSNATWQYNNTSITYAETNQRIAEYRNEIAEIQRLMSARLMSASTQYQADYAKAYGSDTELGSNSSDEQDMLRVESRVGAKAKAQTNALNEQINILQAGKDAIDKLYSTPPPTYNAPNNGGAPSNYMPSGGGSGRKGADDAKKAEEELKKNEKKMIDDITDTYNKDKDIIQNAIEEIDASITTLGDADDGNFTKRIDLTTQKLAKQREEVGKAQGQLDSLKNVTVTTAEAQETLENATLKASKELRTQTLEVYKLEQEMKKLQQEQIKKTFEAQKEIDTETTEANQKAQTKAFEKLKSEKEDLHNQAMNNYESQLKELEKANKEEENKNDLLEKQNDLKEKQAQLDRDAKEKSVQTLVQQSDGSWQYEYVLDQEIVNKDQKAVNEADKSLKDVEKKQQYEKDKEAIEEKKTQEEESYKKKKEYLDKYSDDLKEAQERDKKRIETYYSDIDKLSKDSLIALEKTYNNDYNAIANAVSTKLEKAKKDLEDLKVLRANFTDTEAENAINSGDISGYLSKNKDRMNEKAKVDTEEINKNLQAIDNSADEASNSINSLSKAYEDLLSKKDSNKITEDDIRNRSVQVDKQVDVDLEGLKTSLNNLQTMNKQIEDEYDEHYRKLLEKQNKAQDDQYNSLKNFADVYTKFTDQFLELVQIVYDYRFTNIVSISKASADMIMQSLVVIEEAFEKIVDVWNETHKAEEWISNIDIKSVVADMDKFKESVLGYSNSKASLYDDKNNPLYNQALRSNYTDTSKYMQPSSYSLDSSKLLSSANAITNNNTSNAKTVYQTSISGVTVNANNGEELWDSFISLVERETNLIK